jgi:hypothetical protein
MTTEPTTDREPDGTGPAPGKASGAFTILIAIADIVVPIALYYVFRAAGSSELTSLLISSAAPVVSFAVQGLVLRRLDGFAIFIGAVLALNIVAALTSADPRTLLARDGWITGLAGLFFLATLWTQRPFVFSIARPLCEGRLGPPGEDWDSVWDRFPLFRRVWRVLTVIWGVGLVVDAVIRLVFAYTLPIDIVPASNGIQYFVVYAVLQVISQVYFRRSGLMRLPGFEFRRRRTV